MGLGNPGQQYASTRHNIGWKVVHQAAKQWGMSLELVAQAWQGRGTVGSSTVILALPNAWMNQGGPVVRDLLGRWNIPVTHLVVVHDDLDMPLGSLRIKIAGGAGGHKGIQSLLSSLDTDRFTRLKVGIGRPPDDLIPADYVLAPFNAAEWDLVTSVVGEAVQALTCLLTDGSHVAMNRYHVRQDKK